MKKIQLGILNDYYGKLLNPYQSEVMRMYCDCDMSLAEIASELDITRQGVREVILRSERKLNEYENKLGLIKKVKTIIKNIEEIIQKEDFNAKEDLTKLLNSVKEL